MKLKEINYSFYNNDDTTIIPFGVKTFPSVKVNKDQETPTVEPVDTVVPTFRMSTDYFYMVFSCFFMFLHCFFMFFVFF